MLLQRLSYNGCKQIPGAGSPTPGDNGIDWAGHSILKEACYKTMLDIFDVRY